MPRTLKDAAVTTKAARERLAPRHQPYWRAIEAGAAIGYRKGAMGGVWLVRVADPAAGGGYRQATLSRADDALKAAGDEVMDYRLAEAKAREWIARHHRVAAGLEPEAPSAPAAPFTVAQAITDYLTDYAARGGKAVATTRQAAEAHILPTLGNLPVGRLTQDKLKAWHRALADAPPRLRSKPGKPRHRNTEGDPEAPRRRRSSANRVLTVLKSALNHAKGEGRVSCSADAWAGVKPFREADQAKVRYLHDDEITRLVNVCEADFRALVTAALLTGCRYGEIAAMRVGDFDQRAGTVTIGRSKGGKPRHVALTDEGREFFGQMAAGKSGGALLFERDKLMQQATRLNPSKIRRVPWGKSDQFRATRAACLLAKIAPPVSFHELRHTYGSRLAMRGVPMVVISAQLGHADTRMTEKHYAHLGPTYVAETVRKSFGTLGIVPETVVKSTTQAVERSRSAHAPLADVQLDTVADHV